MSDFINRVITSDLINKVITFEEVTQKTVSNGAVKFKIKGSDGKTYGLWKKKADGGETKAYETLKTLENNGVGQTCEIHYKVEPGNYEGKPIEYKTIMFLKPADKRANATELFEQKLETSSKKEYWDEKDETRAKSIKWLNALNNACLLASQGKIEQDKDSISEFANWLFKLEPTKTPKELMEDGMKAVPKTVTIDDIGVDTGVIDEEGNPVKVNDEDINF